MFFLKLRADNGLMLSPCTLSSLGGFLGVCNAIVLPCAVGDTSAWFSLWLVLINNTLLTHFACINIGAYDDAILIKAIDLNYYLSRPCHMYNDAIIQVFLEMCSDQYIRAVTFGNS